MSKNKQRELNAFKEGVKLGKKGTPLPNWKHNNDEAKAIVRGLMVGLMDYISSDYFKFSPVFYLNENEFFKLKELGFSNRQSSKLANVFAACDSENRKVTSTELANSIGIDISAKI